MDKSPDAFRTISEVAESLDTPAHVLRFWESRFPQIRPVKRAGGRRYYRPSDVALLSGIKRLLHDEGLTIRGVQKILRDQGARHVAGLSDETISIDHVVPLDSDLAEDASIPADDVPEAGFIAVDDADFEPEAPAPRVTDRAAASPAVPSPGSDPSRAQSELPLFDTPPALARSQPPAPTTPRKLTLRDDTTFACLIRQLPTARLASRRVELAGLARRLAALRALAAARADGSTD